MLNTAAWNIQDHSEERYPGLPETHAAVGRVPTSPKFTSQTWFDRVGNFIAMRCMVDVTNHKGKVWFDQAANF